MSVVAVGDGECVYLDLLPCKCTHIHTHSCLSASTVSKARFPLPELTARVNGPIRFPLPVNTGRVDGRAFPLAELTARQLG